MPTPPRPVGQDFQSSPANLAGESMKLRVADVQHYVFNMRTRMPFRFGIVTMTSVPHLFVKLLLEIDGQPFWGVAADHLPPKWLTKNPSSSLADDAADLG